MKIAILYICTGRYNQFFTDFYKSSESFFLLGTSKTYFVWTDDEKLASNYDNVRIIKKK